jgi:hypothetical protein
VGSADVPCDAAREEENNLNKMLARLRPARGRRFRVGIAAAAVVLLALVGGGARLSAATTAITITPTQAPAANVPATLSSAGQTTYVSYSLNLSTKSSWTHVVLSDSAPTVTLNGAPVANSGAAVVFTDCPGATLSGGGFSCNINKLSPGVPQTFTVVVQTPTSGDTLMVDPTVQGDESANDSSNASKPEVFTTPLQWSLTSDTTNALTSYTNPAITTGTATFFTNKNLCGATTCPTKNPQWTEADVPNGVLPDGTLVSLKERNYNSGECPGFVSKASLACYGQISQIGITGSGLSSGFSSNPLTFVVRVAGNSLTTNVNLNKAFLFHDPGTGYEKVPFCSTGKTDSTGDCTVSIVQDKATGDIIWTIQGPSNGNWGGAG